MIKHVTCGGKRGVNDCNWSSGMLLPFPPREEDLSPMITTVSSSQDGRGSSKHFVCTIMENNR